MNRECNSKRNCPEDSDPLTDYSSEAPDKEIVFATQTQNFMPPPLGSNFVTSNCYAIEQGETLEEAQGNALSSVVDCIASHGVTPPTQILPDPPGTPPENRDPNVFQNADQLCTALCPDGLPFTFIVPAGRFTAFSQIEADQMAHSFACTNVVAARLCVGSISPPECCLNQPFSTTITSTKPANFSVFSGALPTGLRISQLNPTTGLISGTPTAVGQFQFALRATDANGDYMQKAFQMITAGIITSSIPSSQALIPYSVTFVGSTLSFGTMVWSLVSGSLPAGLSFNPANQTLSGTPTEGGTFNFTLQITDGIVQCRRSFVLTVVPCIAFYPSTAFHWYDASQLAGSDGDQVSSFKDSTSNHNDWLVQGGIHLPPILKVAARNGRNILRWQTAPADNSNAGQIQKAIGIGNYNFVLNGLNQLYVFWAGANTSAGAQHGVLEANFIGAGGGVFYVRSSNVNQSVGMIYSRAGEAQAHMDSTFITTVGQWNMIMWHINFAAGTARIDVDGTTYYNGSGCSTTGASAQNSQTSLPQSTAGEQRDWGELILDANLLTQDQIDKYFGYLALKWGLQANLPANHPYKNATPCL